MNRYCAVTESGKHLRSPSSTPEKNRRCNNGLMLRESSCMVSPTLSVDAAKFHSQPRSLAFLKLRRV